VSLKYKLIIPPQTDLPDGLFRGFRLTGILVSQWDWSRGHGPESSDILAAPYEEDIEKVEEETIIQQLPVAKRMDGWTNKDVVASLVNTPPPEELQGTFSPSQTPPDTDSGSLLFK
jgi:hypothetical protein